MSMSTSNNSRDKIKVTVGIPAYNEKGRIGSLLLAMVNQARDNVNEIVVNVSGSTDGTKGEVVKTVHAFPKSLVTKVISGEKRMGKAAALDQILAYSEGDVIVFIDADTLLGRRCIDRVARPFFLNKNLGVVGGNVLSLNDGNGLFSFMSRFQRELHHHLCKYLVRRDLPPKVNGSFFAVRKGLVKHLPHHVVSDDEFISWCAQKQGYTVAYAPDAVVYTKDPTNLKDYIAKRKRICEGHILIKKQLNYTVPTASVRLVFPTFLKLASKYWRKMLHIIFMLLMEFVCRVLAIFDVVRGKLPYSYRVESAKFTVKDYEAWIDS